MLRSVYDEYGFSWDSEEYMADIYDVEKHYIAQGDFFWVSEGDEGINGTVGLELFPVFPHGLGPTLLVEGKLRVCGTDCSLERLYVLSSARNQGIGSSLMRHCMAKAKGMGRRSMEIWSDKHFADAHRLYEKQGAKVIGERICDDPDKSPEWGLVLPL